MAETKSGVECRYFKEGRCTRGAECRFSHVPGGNPLPRDPVKKLVPCMFFLAGTCNRGDKCAYFHMPGGGPAAEGGISRTPSAPPPCKFFMMKKCTKGESCPFLHAAKGAEPDQSGPAVMPAEDEPFVPGTEAAAAFTACKIPKAPRLGLDFGGCFVPMASGAAEGEDTMFSEKFLTSPANEGCFEAVKLLVDSFGPENVFVVSKAGSSMEQRTRAWLEHNEVHTKCGLPKENLYFCQERKDKAPICERLEITHFVDDRLDVLQHLSPLPRIARLALFRSGAHGEFDPKELARMPPHTHTLLCVCHSWAEVAKVVSAGVGPNLES